MQRFVDAAPASACGPNSAAPPTRPQCCWSWAPRRAGSAGRSRWSTRRPRTTGSSATTTATPAAPPGPSPPPFGREGPPSAPTGPPTRRGRDRRTGRPRHRTRASRRAVIGRHADPDGARRPPRPTAQRHPHGHQRPQYPPVHPAGRWHGARRGAAGHRTRGPGDAGLPSGGPRPGGGDRAPDRTLASTRRWSTPVRRGVLPHPGRARHRTHRAPSRRHRPRPRRRRRDAAHRAAGPERGAGAGDRRPGRAGVPAAAPAASRPGGQRRVHRGDPGHRARPATARPEATCGGDPGAHGGRGQPSGGRRSRARLAEPALGGGQFRPFIPNKPWAGFSSSPTSSDWTWASSGRRGRRRPSRGPPPGGGQDEVPVAMGHFPVAGDGVQGMEGPVSHRTRLIRPPAEAGGEIFSPGSPRRCARLRPDPFRGRNAAVGQVGAARRRPRR